jgi:hypothetical protein
MTTPTTPTPGAILPVFPIQVFDDVARIFKPGEMTLAEITAIADAPTMHYGFSRALECVRVQLGPGKWAYVASVQINPLRSAWAQWQAEHPAAPAAPPAPKPRKGF